MKKFQAVLAATLVFAASSALAASTGNVPVVINANVAALAKLTIPAAITFASADPDVTPSIPATENPVAVRTQVRTGSASAVSLTVLSAGDLTNGTVAEDIGIGAVTWTAAGNGFVAGTMDKTTAQSAGAWTGSGDRSSTFSYNLANSWSYAPGSYTATVNYVLSAP